MISVRATYDGKKLSLREKIKIKTPKEVIVTFLDPIEPDNTEDPSADEVQRMAQEGGALDFLNDEREDIYSRL